MGCARPLWVAFLGLVVLRKVEAGLTCRRCNDPIAPAQFPPPQPPPPSMRREIGAARVPTDIVVGCKLLKRARVCGTSLRPL
jgi:hypothetical protein